MNNESRKNRTIFFLRVILPAILAFSLFAGLIFGYMIPGFEKAMMDKKREMILELTRSAWSVCDHYQRLETEGSLSGEEAQREAIRAIREIRYGEDLKDYFWITDLGPSMIMHPYRPEMESKDLSQYRDPHGKAIFVEFAEKATASGGGYVDYMWQWKDDSSRIVPKLSHVILFKPWNWVIGTGIYIEDVRQSIRRMELQAMLISGAIGLIMIILLVFMARQSHQIEVRRREAEQELRESRERYRALAEAASEGVLIWSAGGLHMNRTLLAWLGYREEELRNKHLAEVLLFAPISIDTRPEMLYEELSARQSAECEMIREDNSLIRVHADLSAILLQDQPAVMLVARPVDAGPKTENALNTLYDSVSCGFFKTTFARRNRFISASLPTLDILGFHDPEALLSYSIESFFADPAERKAFLRELSEKKQLRSRAIRVRRKDKREIYALVSVIVLEDLAGNTWAEGCIESLGSTTDGRVFLDTGLPADGLPFLQGMKAGQVYGSAGRCDMYDSIPAALAKAGKDHPEYILVNTPEDMPLGILKVREIAYLLSGGADAGQPVFRLMVSPPPMIPDSLSLADAIPLLNESATECLIVSDADGKPAGLLSRADILHALEAWPLLFVKNIQEARTINELKDQFDKVRKLMMQLLESRQDIRRLSAWYSMMSDQITKRVIALCLEACGPAPLPFAFIQLGSAGRREQSLLTDQDNALITGENEKNLSDESRRYFLNLGGMLNQHLDKIGFSLCKGGIMAGNEKWCQPLDKWQDYFTRWAKNPGPEELLEISIFYDLSQLHGDTSLVDELHRHVFEGIRTNDIFCRLMTATWMPYAPEKHYDPEGPTNLKTLLMPLTGIVRLYALVNNVRSAGTVDRILALYKCGVFTRKMTENLLQAWEFLTLARLQHQAHQLREGRMPDNQPDLKMLGPYTKLGMEQAVSAIKDLLQQAELGFQARTL